MTLDVELPSASALGLQSSIRGWRRYPSYKDSGVAWLGRVPSHWETRKLKHIARFFGGGTPSSEMAEYWTGDIPWVSPKDMKAEIIGDSQDHISPLALSNSATMLVPSGSVLMVVRSGILKHTIPVAIAARSLTLNQDMKAIFLQECLRPDYLAATIRGHQSALLVEWRKAGATVESIEHELVAQTEVLIPPLDEQTKIASFIDRETANIDALVAKKRQLLGLIEEKRSALISHVVMKGLDPTAPMKNSGIGWLGQVPAHWTVSRLKFAARLESGHTPSRSVAEYWQNCTIPWVSLADVHQIRRGGVDVINDTAEKISELGLANSSARLLPADTVILSRTASVGFSAILGQPMATTQDFANWICGPRLRPRYLLQVLRSMTPEYRRLTMGSTHQTIYMPDIAEFTVPLPPLDEQDRIVDYIEEESQRLGKLTDKLRRHIELLGEYRTALISAAVTGKIDVRDQGAGAG